MNPQSGVSWVLVNVAKDPYSGNSGSKERQAQDEDHKTGKLGDAARFTQKFILTYQYVLVGLLMVFTAHHWLRKLQRAKVQHARLTTREVTTSKSQGCCETSKKIIEIHERGRHGSLTSSSSSSTLECGTWSNTGKDDDEYTSLLTPARTRRPKVYLRGRLKAFLTYQPQPMPIVHKVLPPNGTTLWVIGLIGLNLFYTFCKCPMEFSEIFIVADRAGILFAANLPLLYFLAAKNQPIKWLTGYSYESLNIFHRRLGEVMCLLAVLHAAGMVGVWYTIFRPIRWSFLFFLSKKIILLGLLALICYGLLYLTSLGSFRKRWYELFLASHVFLQAAALILVWFHHHRSRVYIGIAIGIFLVDRVIFRIMLKSRHIPADLKVLQDELTVTISADWRVTHGDASWLRMLGLDQNIKAGWKTTQHVFLTIPALSCKHNIQAHPFTIASPAPSTSDQSAKLNLLVRAQNGFSKDLVKYAQDHSSTIIRLDGPYGSVEALEMLLASDVSVIVAGGSGIAVGYPLICALVDAVQHAQRDNHVELCVARKLLTRICLLWVVHEPSHITWLGPDRLRQLRNQGVSVVVPPPTHVFGRPDVRWHVESFIEGCTNGDDHNEKIGVLCSGPDGMNRAVRNSCAALCAQGRDVSITVEKFGW